MLQKKSMGGKCFICHLIIIGYSSTYKHTECIYRWDVGGGGHSDCLKAWWTVINAEPVHRFINKELEQTKTIRSCASRSVLGREKVDRLWLWESVQINDSNKKKTVRAVTVNWPAESHYFCFMIIIEQNEKQIKCELYSTIRINWREFSTNVPAKKENRLVTDRCDARLSVWMNQSKRPGGIIATDGQSKGARLTADKMGGGGARYIQHHRINHYQKALTTQRSIYMHTDLWEWTTNGVAGRVCERQTK